MVDLVAFTGELEHQFTILREQLYQERVKQNDMCLNDVRNGRSQEYVEPLKQLTEQMQSRIEVAGVLKRLRLENINHKFSAEEQAALQHFEVSSVLMIFFNFFSAKNTFNNDYIFTSNECRVKKSSQKMQSMKS